jgi:hypothetical protein
MPTKAAKITMYGGATAPFFLGNAVGGKYQNPREAVWNDGTTFTIPNGTHMFLYFLLPQIPIIDCCELKGNICVKLTFRDTNCKECEEIVCFPFVLKKGIITPLMNSSPLSKGSFIPNGLFQK